MDQNIHRPTESPSVVISLLMMSVISYRPPSGLVLYLDVVHGGPINIKSNFNLGDFLLLHFEYLPFSRLRLHGSANLLSMSRQLACVFQLLAKPADVASTTPLSLRKSSAWFLLKFPHRPADQHT